MANYQDFSEILMEGNFEEQSYPPKQTVLSLVDQLVQSQLASANGDIQRQIHPNNEILKKDTTRLDFDYQEFFPSYRSENSTTDPVQKISENQSSQSQTFDQFESSKKNSRKCGNDTLKNIIGNITKKSMDTMLKNKKHRAYIRMKCKKSQINYKEFEKYFTCILKKIYGPQSIAELFKISQERPQETKMKQLFEKVFMKIVRTRYPIYLLKKGKMRDSHEYFQIKNKKLLYFPQQIQSQNAMKNSGV